MKRLKEGIEEGKWFLEHQQCICHRKFDVNVHKAMYLFPILLNRFDFNITSGNIVSDVSDHYSQFCILHSVKEQMFNRKTKKRDFSNFSENDFIADLSDIKLKY